MPRRRDSQASSAHAQAMRDRLAVPALPLEPVGAAEPQEPQPKGRGRPPGARNWVNGQIEKYLEARGYVHPCLGWAEICSRSIEQLARELHTTREKAAAVWLKASENLAPYVAQQLPKAVQIDSRGDFQLTIELGGAAGTATVLGAGGGILIEGEALDVNGEKSKV